MERDRARRSDGIVTQNDGPHYRNHRPHAALGVAASSGVVVAWLAGLADPCRENATARNPADCHPHHVDRHVVVVWAQRHRYLDLGGPAARLVGFPIEAMPWRSTESTAC